MIIMCDSSTIFNMRSKVIINDSIEWEIRRTTVAYNFILDAHRLSIQWKYKARFIHLTVYVYIIIYEQYSRHMGVIFYDSYILMGK